MSRIFAIGDIHGCHHTFRKMISDGIRPTKQDHIYCIGDYIDRGPDSKGVIDYILQLRREGYHIHTLRGNHEQLMLDSKGDRQKRLDWYINGGDKTLKSFGVSTFEEMDPVYQEFFRRTRYYFQTPDFIFVHAGLNFNRVDPFEDRDAMLWIRGFVTDSDKIGGRTIIHGHTPEPLDVILHQKREDILNIDAGCVYKHKEAFGHLVAFNLTDSEWIVQKNEEE